MKFFFPMIVCCISTSMMAMEYDQSLSDTTTKSIFPYTVPEYREEMLKALQNFVYEFDAKKPLNFQDIERLVLQQAKLSYPEVFKAYQDRKTSRQGTFHDYVGEFSY